MFRRFLPMMAATALLAASASAQTLPDVVAEADVLPGWRTEDGTHMAGLRIRMAPGWKTYWRAPGDAGIPPQFGWAGSENIGAVRISWPVPEVFEQNGMRSIGYSGQVILPMEVTPQAKGAPITLSARIDIGVCEVVCIPMTLDVAQILPPDSLRPDPAIRAALADRPLTRGEAGVTGVECRIEPIDDGLRLTARIEMPRMGYGEAAVIELTDRPVWVAETETRRDGAGLYAVTDLVPEEAQPFVLNRSALRFTVLSNGGAVDIRGCD